MCADNVEFDKLLASIHEVFGKHCIPMTLPIGQSRDFTGVVSVLKPPASVPAGVIGDVSVHP